jgi:hypothetical protein
MRQRTYLAPEVASLGRLDLRVEGRVMEPVEPPTLEGVQTNVPKSSKAGSPIERDDPHHRAARPVPAHPARASA